ncbi:hypothetical protein Anas_12575, partial [Armadillidium nasatum]
ELNGKYYTSTILEDHYVITGEPGDFYLDHFSPESGKGIDIAHGIYKKVCGTELENRLSLVKADGTNVNTGHRNGSISYFAHGENILIAMLADEEEEVRVRAVNKLLNIKGLNEIFTCEDSFEGGVVESESEDEPAEDDETKYPPMNKGVRTFLKPKINFNASSYHTMTPISQWEIIPPILNAMSEAEIKNLIYNPLELRHDCHSQNVERHIKLVTEASLAVVGHDRRDGLIRNKIRSRKLMKTFVSKSNFKF